MNNQLQCSMNRCDSEMLGCDRRRCTVRIRELPNVNDNVMFIQTNRTMAESIETLLIVLAFAA